MELNFKDWKTECKRLLYKLNTNVTDENIAYVDMVHYKDYYLIGLTPKEANNEAYLDSVE